LVPCPQGRDKSKRSAKGFQFKPLLPPIVMVMMPSNGGYFEKFKLQVKAKVEAKDK
jgi:hypothetical protein